MGSSSSKREAKKKEEEIKKKEERIDEAATNHARPITEESSEKLYKSIVRIQFVANEKMYFGTGFFIKFNLKNKLRYFLMTCHHVIKEEFINKKQIITLHTEKSKKKKNLKLN